MMKVFLATIWYAALLIAVGSAMPNKINHRWEENYPVELTPERDISEVADLQDAEFNGEQSYNQIEDDLDSVLELMKEMGTEAHLEQKTKKGKANENSITENEANEMRGLRKVASTEMERRMRNIGKDQEFKGASKDLMRQKVVKAQFIRGIFHAIKTIGKAIGRAIGRGAKRVVKKIPKKPPKVRDLPDHDIGGEEPNEATNAPEKIM